MVRPLFSRLFASAALLSVLTACGVLEPDDADRLTLYVAPTTVDCVGVGPQRCLLVKERPDEEWGYFYSSIAGFTHETGYSYTLLLERSQVSNPPADGSSYEYRLLRVLAKSAATPPA